MVCLTFLPVEAILVGSVNFQVARSAIRDPWRIDVVEGRGRWPDARSLDGRARRV